MHDTVPMTRHKLDVDAYHRMAEVGILGEDDRVELIGGELIDMAPIGLEHAAIVTGLNRALVRACNDLALVSPQNPVRLDRLSEPQPDFAILRPKPNLYASGERPGPADILLLVEVADSSIRYDRAVKLPLYGSAGVPEYWIVDIQRRVLDAYRQTEKGGYGEPTTHGPGERLALSACPEIVVTLDLVFG